MECGDSENEVDFQLFQTRWVWQSKNKFYFAFTTLKAAPFQRDANFIIEFELCAKFES